MIQLSSLLLVFSIFFAIIGFSRGWSNELGSLAGIIFAIFALFQLDNLLRSSIFLILSREQSFVVQAGLFLAFVFFVYRTLQWGRGRPGGGWMRSFLGGVVGFGNGYLISSTIWYFLDVNLYPFEPYVLPPAIGSQAAQMVQIIPIVAAGSGINATTDALVVAVIAMLFIILIAQ